MQNSELAQNQHHQHGSTVDQAGSKRQYFQDGHWGQCLELLQHLCQYSDNILSVIGPSGMGKSSLLQALVDGNSSDLKCCGLSAATCDALPTALAAIANGFGLPWPVDENDQQAKSAWLDQLSRHEQTWVLLIDDAEQISKEVLQALIQLAYPANSRIRFHLVFFGLPELEKNLHKIKLNETSKVHVIELEALMLDEVEGFLANLWHASGNYTELPFDQKTIKRIHQLSHGIPGQVEKIARGYLSGNKIEKPSRQLLRQMFSPLGIGLTVIAGLMLAFMVAVLLIDYDKPEETAATPKKEVVVEDTTINENTDQNKIESLKSLTTKASNTNRLTLTPEATPQPLALESELDDVEPVEAEPEIASPKDTLIIPAPKQQLAAESEEMFGEKQSQQPNQDQSALSHAIKQPALKPQPSEQPKQATAESQEIESQEDVIKTKEEQIAELAKVKTQKASVKAASPAAKPVVKAQKPAKQTSANKFTWSENHLLTRSREHYALQLVAGGSEGNIKKFVEQHKLKGKAFYYQSARQGKPWFVLIYGDFKDRNSAMVARQNLPSAVQNLKPWPRSYQDIQKSIKASR